MAAPPRTIRQLVAKLKVENEAETAYQCLSILILLLSEQPDNAAGSIARVDGIQVMIGVMKRFPRSMQIQCYGCQILNVTMRVNASYKRDLINNGGIQCTLSVVEDFKDGRRLLSHMDSAPSERWPWKIPPLSSKESP